MSYFSGSGPNKWVSDYKQAKKIEDDVSTNLLYTHSISSYDSNQKPLTLDKEPLCRNSMISMAEDLPIKDDLIKNFNQVSFQSPQPVTTIFLCG